MVRWIVALQTDELCLLLTNQNRLLTSKMDNEINIFRVS